MFHPLRNCVLRRRLELALLISALLAPAPPRADAAPYTFSWSNPTPQGNGLGGIAFENAGAGYAVGRLGAVLRTGDGGATWVNRTRVAIFAADLKDVAVLGPGHLLAVGESPGLYRSTDAGETWAPVSSLSPTTMHNLHRVDVTTLTAVGDAGTVLRSADNGVTWTALTSPGDFGLRDQFWSSALDGYVVGAGCARHTNDGGQTWTTLPGVSEVGLSEFQDVFFLDGTNGWILEHFNTYRTTNGGASWFLKNADFPRPIYQHEGLWIDASTRFVATNLEGAEIWKTLDDGVTWTQLFERNNTEGITDIDRLPDGTLVSVSTDGDLLRSADSGATWQNFTLSPGSGERHRLNRMAFLPGVRAFAGGDGGLWLRSDDAGAKWTFGVAPPGLEITHEIEFLNDELGFAGGTMTPSSPSRICRTTDGGASWTAHTLAPQFGWVQGIWIVDAQTQFAVTYAGDDLNKVFRSTNGGTTWEERGGVLPIERVECLQFLDASVGIAAGQEAPFGACVIRTTDAGATWTKLAGVGLVGISIYEMHWIDASTAVAAGDGGIFHTTNGGASWTRTLAVGMGDLDFRDALSGFACNHSGAMWQTSDGGLTWAQVPLPWTGGATSVEAPLGGFVVCGFGSVILTAREPGPAGVAGPVLDAGPRRLAIAPNPAAGTIQMRFESGAAGTCVVAIFDAAGRRVASFDRPVSRGPVALDWFARGSGAYFVTLRDPAGIVHRGRFVLRAR